jgi:hypothetical protein
MTDRDADAEKLAGAMGWTFTRGEGLVTCFRSSAWADRIPIPAADAPLGEQLAFVGRLAEQLGPGVALDSVNNDRHDGWMVRFANPWPELARGVAPDLVHAAIRAALNAKGAT